MESRDGGAFYSNNILDLSHCLYQVQVPGSGSFFTLFTEN